MNRLHHLKETLPMNLVDNNDIKNIEFVILDYNSNDGLENWMRENLDSFGEKVVYFRTIQPSFYNRSHSRNMVFRLATGDILCNLDADNFTGKGFAAYLISQFQQESSIFIAPDKNSLSDTFGKISMLKRDFLTVRGYDETIKGYGFEDNDLKNRLINLGRNEKFFGQAEFLRAITHTEEERIRNEFIYNNLTSIFVEKISHRESKLILHFKDNTYESALVIDGLFSNFQTHNALIKPLDFMNRYYIFEKSIEKGVFSKDLISNASLISEHKTIISTVNFYSQLTNKVRFIENFQHKRIAVNKESFGNGIVTKNFIDSNPIILA